MIDLYNVKKTYAVDSKKIEALKGITLHVDKSDIFGVIGFSGAGKSTLIRCINLLEKPDSGKIIVNNQDMMSLTENELRKARQKIGMIFQHFNLLRSKNVYQNVAFPLQHTGMNKNRIKEKVEGLLELVGLQDKLSAYPSQLSGGQKQRVAIARALANDPMVLLSDEATSALDPQTTYSILSLLNDLNKKLDLTIVLITHEMTVVKEICNKVAVIEGGVIVEQGNSADIFIRPKHRTTRKFIDSIFQTDKINQIVETDKISKMISNNGVVVHMLFTGRSANNAYISEVSRKFDVNVNIIFGKIEIIQSQPIGSLFAVICGDPIGVGAAINYLEDKSVQVVKLDVDDIPSSGREVI